MGKIEYLETELRNYCRTRNWSLSLDVRINHNFFKKTTSELCINRSSLCQGSGGNVIVNEYLNNLEKYDLFFLESICPIILDHDIDVIKFLLSYTNNDSYYSIIKTNILQDKTFCFTGNCKFTSYKRIVNRYGGLVNKDITKNTQVLVTGFKLVDESKIEFAKQNNIEIIDELTFRKYLVHNCITYNK